MEHAKPFGAVAPAGAVLAVVANLSAGRDNTEIAEGGLDVEEEVHYVTVLDDIFLALDSHLAGGAHG